MTRPSPVRLAVHAALAGAALIGIALAPRPSMSQALSGFDLYRSNCDGCHELYDPEEPKRSRQEWQTILTRMVKERGATLNQREFGAVLNYLDSFNRPRREIQWVDAPAKSHKAAFTSADAGKLPAEWVDLTLGGDAQVPWAVQADPSGKAVYLSPLKSAGEGQFPVVIDNTGVVENGGASVRAQLVSGKGSVGAGIVFGFRSPQSYYGVRLSPRDVILYEVQNGQRALLARYAAALPMKQWQTLAVQVDGKSVKVTLNAKPLPELSRTLPAYRGGRMGVHTQGDTLALFDEWAVTVP
jgi:hypothetical protein